MTGRVYAAGWLRSMPAAVRETTAAISREVEGAISGYQISVIERDARMQPGAYVTDGVDLYEVVGMQRGPGARGVSTVRITVENCRTLRCLEFLPDKIRSSFELVKSAPVGQCPDVVDDIAWDQAAHPRAA